MHKLTGSTTVKSEGTMKRGHSQQPSVAVTMEGRKSGYWIIMGVSGLRGRTRTLSPTVNTKRPSQSGKPIESAYSYTAETVKASKTGECEHVHIEINLCLCGNTSKAAEKGSSVNQHEVPKPWVNLKNYFETKGEKRRTDLSPSVEMTTQCRTRFPKRTKSR